MTVGSFESFLAHTIIITPVSIANPYVLYIIDRLKEVPTVVYSWLLFIFCCGSVFSFTLIGCKKGLRWSARLLLLEYLFLVFLSSVLIRTVQSERSFNITPFWSYRVVHTWNQPVLIQSVINVVAFIPVGLLIGISFPKINKWRVLLIASAFSLIIETAQFFMKRGFAEFDDVFHNVLGSLTGYATFVVVALIVKKLSNSNVVG